MKYWKEQESNPVENMEFWKGTTITKLADNEIFVMGTNPSGIHGAGAAKAGLKFGAKIGFARGKVGSTWGLITKNLEGKEGFVEKETGLVYEKAGFRSVSEERIRENILELYTYAKNNPHEKYLITYQYEAWPNGTPKKSLNGYTSKEILDMFLKDQDIPSNIVFHESYKPHLEKLLQNENKQSNVELVVCENDKIIDIKEENIIWTIDSDERNPSGIHGAGAAKTAVQYGAKYGVGRGLQGQSYALVTKNLKPNYTEKSTGITYHTEGYRSVSPEQIRFNIDELYECARNNPDKEFIITYQFDTWPNGSPKKSLNGYDSKEFLLMFVRDDIPPNIIFHDSYKPFIEANLTNSIKNTAATSANVEIPSEIAFTKVALPYGWLGNMAPYPIQYNSVTYPTTEALFQALRFENHPEIQKEIIAQKSPMSAKMVAKKYKHLLEAEGYELMGEKDVDNMRLCVKLKLEQYPELAQELINTGAAKIIEDCSSRPRDSGLFWGAAKTENGWNGKNVLGEIFMDYRTELQNNQPLSQSLEEKEPTYTFFFQATSPFSQWHPALFIYKELQFICTEQFMMYAKAKTFKDEAVASKIINIEKCFDTRDDKGYFKTKDDEDCYNLVLEFKEGKIDRTQIVSNYKTLNTWKKVQAVIKKLGREVANYDDEVWKQKRVPVVSVGNREKYNQNPDLKDTLMATGDSIMVEASPYDKLSTTQRVVHDVTLSLRDYFKQQNQPKVKP
jgi:ribA/ribD-fused uncharacterized protein